jgi:succinate dehydrogenase / fumarate reductase membrane anchor subunit
MLRDRTLWTWHIIAGAVIVPLLVLHMVVMHLDSTLGWGNPAGGHAIDWANVVARGQTLFYPVTYVLLLVAALYHGLYGLRNILLELAPPAWLARTIGWVLLLVGLGLGALGLWAAIVSHQVAAAAPIGG